MARHPKELLSMTGFGTAKVELKNAHIVCEIRCVNHRGLDAKFRLPSQLISFEGELLKEISKKFVRGRVDVMMDIIDDHKVKPRVMWNQALAEDLIADVAQFQKKHRQIGGELRIGDLFSVRELFSTPQREFNEKESHAAAQKVLVMAIEEALNARAQEGRRLKSLVESSLHASERLVREISKKLSHSAPKHFKQLQKKVTDLLGSNELDATRLAQEVAYIAERADVAEEIGRLGAHIGHFENLLAIGGPCGRKLDFLCQEMFREANTASSKITDVATTYLVVDLKSEIERIREQVQNIE